ncbi:exodeoxyribonuclease VII large subunit [Acinetobacter sp. KAM398]|uniref:ribosomal protein uL16 3-hydroxylase n=1 Tax=unclassified Acinetobacter TaxID=196816 RepID=UPI001F2A4C8A|nr:MULTISPECIES: cupin domain-containing protein [unclassified Acinetobacter]GJC31216.1 exodeoxyribonuclease VII large subunit [Acinetobacter sp. KAM392]GJC33970.1 exodeoxyribonuclease VII large subunit [Acinetobacter sp. KAM393]GJC36853.1 exodeoxyribonuclease VII large subunit [Acinetobacter sp. KAM394]GJC39618.1 exodeoxyribonuclease VII large subunit [Acinetobacter sp. KAM395]GJC42600.1 exodeoxyribonuclease VII large subunit [Acinetobacter sp. KAM396]
MSQPFDVLGGITAEQFLSEYWQKKPLLVRNALPEIVHLLEPSDVMELALEEDVTARLIKQKDRDPNQWTVKSSPLIKADFQKMPKLWTLLVQAVDHYSFDLAELWKKFPFIPQWRRDDIMVSYAPKGGSVGQHFDFYDVFLIQGYGHRRWQLGQMCDAETEFVPGQPLKLLPEMQVNFDEVLAPGDLLYVPPGLAHYGVAEDDCLTFSFGFRMPNISEMMDRVSDKFSADEMLRTPLQDILREKSTQIGEMTATELDYLKAELWARLQNSSVLDDAILSLMSEPKYPENIPEVDEMGVGDLEDALDQGYQIMLEPASRLLYVNQQDAVLFWANGEAICVAEESIAVLQKIANGERVLLDENLYDADILENLVQLLNESILMLLPAEDA